MVTSPPILGTWPSRPASGSDGTPPAHVDADMRRRSSARQRRMPCPGTVETIPEIGTTTPGPGEWNPFRQGIQLLPSGAIPPPGTRQCRWLLHGYVFRRSRAVFPGFPLICSNGKSEARVKDALNYHQKASYCNPNVRPIFLLRFCIKH